MYPALSRLDHRPKLIDCSEPELQAIRGEKGDDMVHQSKHVAMGLFPDT